MVILYMVILLVTRAVAGFHRRQSRIGEPAPGAAFVVGDGLRPLAGSPPRKAAIGLAGHQL